MVLPEFVPFWWYALSIMILSGVSACAVFFIAKSKRKGDSV